VSQRCLEILKLVIRDKKDSPALVEAIKTLDAFPDSSKFSEISKAHSQIIGQMNLAQEITRSVERLPLLINASSAVITNATLGKLYLHLSTREAELQQVHLIYNPPLPLLLSPPPPLPSSPPLVFVLNEL